MIVEHVQRWTERRASRRPAGEVIRTAAYDVGHYVGRTNPCTLRLLPDGTCYSNRTSGKLAQGDVGRRYAAAQLERWGADPLRDDEDALTWLRRWRGRLTRPMRHRGNHRYLWCFDGRRRREVLAAPRCPYPKLDLCAAA